MAFKKISVTGIPLTVELAQEFANLQPMPGERDVKPGRIQFLAQLLRDATFDGPEWARGDCGEGGMYRLDGQHTSHLLANLESLAPGVAFPAGLLVTLTEYQFDSVENDGPPLFDKFNHPKSSRTNEEAMGVYRARRRSLSEIPNRMLSKIAAGILEQQRGIKNGVVYSPRALGLYWKNDQFTHFAEWCASYETTKNSGFLSQRGIVAEMFADWREDHTLAEEFWDFVFRETHPDADHETRTLAETYRDMAIKRKHRTVDYRKRAITAWKHFRRGHGLRLPEFTHAAEPGDPHQAMQT
jgi:hypothetical protein